jgi:hypothetical protein
MNADRADQWPQIGASVIGASVRQWLVAKRKRRQQKMLIVAWRSGVFATTDHRILICRKVAGPGDCQSRRGGSPRAPR